MRENTSYKVQIVKIISQAVCSASTSVSSLSFRTFYFFAVPVGARLISKCLYHFLPNIHNKVFCISLQVFVRCSDVPSSPCYAESEPVIHTFDGG